MKVLSEYERLVQIQARLNSLVARHRPGTIPVELFNHLDNALEEIELHPLRPDGER